MKTVYGIILLLCVPLAVNAQLDSLSSIALKTFSLYAGSLYPELSGKEINYWDTHPKPLDPLYNFPYEIGNDNWFSKYRVRFVNTDKRHSPCILKAVSKGQEQQYPLFKGKYYLSIDDCVTLSEKSFIRIFVFRERRMSPFRQRITIKDITMWTFIVEFDKQQVVQMLGFVHGVKGKIREMNDIRFVKLQH